MPATSMDQADRHTQGGQICEHAPFRKGLPQTFARSNANLVPDMPSVQCP